MISAFPTIYLILLIKLKEEFSSSQVEEKRNKKVNNFFTQTIINCPFAFD